MIYFGFKLCSFVRVPKWISCNFFFPPSRQHFCPSHISSLFVSQELLACLWSFLWIVKTQLLVGQAKCVCEFLLKIMYWEHLREIDSDCEGERGTETRIEVDWGKENGGASWRSGWAAKIYSRQRVSFPSMEAGSLCAASVGRRRQEERRLHERDGGRQSCL